MGVLLGVVSDAAAGGGHGSPLPGVVFLGLPFLKAGTSLLVLGLAVYATYALIFSILALWRSYACAAWSVLAIHYVSSIIAIAVRRDYYGLSIASLLRSFADVLRLLTLPLGVAALVFGLAFALMVAVGSRSRTVTLQGLCWGIVVTCLVLSLVLVIGGEGETKVYPTLIAGAVLIGAWSVSWSALAKSVWYAKCAWGGAYVLTGMIVAIGAGERVGSHVIDPYPILVAYAVLVPWLAAISPPPVRGRVVILALLTMFWCTCWLYSF
jgi:hypothetical protein